MRVGLDVFTIRELKLAPSATLAFAVEHELEGVQFGGLRSLSRELDPGELHAVRQEADDRGLYTHVSVPPCNPYLAKGSLDDHRAELTAQIEAAAACGWHELHTALGGLDERFQHPAPWLSHLTEAAALIRHLGPVLRANGSRVDLETHGDTTTFELVRLVETVGPDICGICLDTANVLCHVEDPVLAAKRAAPYTHLTHVKDGIVYFSEQGYTRQGKPIGEGILEWETILPVLAEHSPDLPLSIEDHKWLFDFAIFDDWWLGQHPDLTREELARVVKLVARCERAIAAGRMPEPAAYEAIPLEDQLLERIAISRDHLKSTLTRLGLRQGGAR